MSIKIYFSAADAGFTSTVKKVNESMKGMDSNVKSVSGSVKASFASMVKAGAALAIGVGAVKAAIGAVTGTLGTFKDALDLGGRLSDFSARTGETVDKLVVLERAFQNNGLSAEKSAATLNKMQRALVEAGQGTGTAKVAFEKLGLQINELLKLSPAEQFDTIGKALQKLPTSAERSAAAMQIFGRSGGELLTLFGNFDSEISTAKDQIGSFGGVMARNSEIFDRISDNITVIKGKFLEFAAGMLDKMAPAFALATELLTRFDAAAAGMRLAEVITGASNAMKGFSDAFAAVKLGEFGEAWKIAWNSIKLQAADSINSIWANLKAVSAAIPELFNGSGMLIAFESVFSGVANIISAKMRGVISDFLDAIGKVNAASEMRLISEADEARAKNYFKTASAAFDSLGENAKAAAEKASEIYDETVKSTENLISTTQLEIDLQKAKVGLLAKQVEEAKKQGAAAAENLGLEITFSGQRVTNAQRIKELEGEIKSARDKGNDALAKELDAQKKYYEEIERALASGKTMQEAMASAAQVYSAQAEKAANAQGKVTKELKEQLSLSQQLAKEIKEAQGKDSVDKGGRNEKRVREAIAEGNFRKAERSLDRIKRGEDNDIIKRFVGGEGGVKKSLRDMAKDEGIDPFRKSSKDLREELAEIAKRRQAEMQPGAAGKKGKGGGAAGGGGAPKNPMDDLPAIVSEIKAILSRIEPKLPPAALGV